jgi:inner membrane protein
MMAPTHLAFGVLAVSLFGLIAGASLTPEAFGFAVLGALLPDVDTTASTIGRLCYPLAWYLERRFGHRGITHSLVGLVIAALVSLIFVSFRALSWLSWSAFVAGYLSHLMADSMNKEGIPLFWPNTTYLAVLPGNEAYRIKVRSGAEFVLLACLLPIIALVVPLSQVSLTGALHYLIRSPSSAVDDYQAWAGQHLVWVELEGRHNLSQKPVQGVFEAIGTAGQNAIVIRDGTGNIYAAGNSRDDQIYVHSIRAVKGIPIRTEIQEVHLADELLGDLFTHVVLSPTSQVPSQPPYQMDLGPRTSDLRPLEVWVEGWLVTPSNPVLIDGAGEFNRSKRAQGVAGESLFELRFFTPADLASFQDIYITRAHFILRTVYPSQEQQLKENTEPWRLVLNHALSYVEGHALSEDFGDLSRAVKGLALKVIEEATKVIAWWL